MFVKLRCEFLFMPIKKVTVILPNHDIIIRTYFLFTGLDGKGDFNE